jgi:thioredoxin-related protein
MNKKLVMILVGIMVFIGSLTLAHMHFTKQSNMINKSLFASDISYAQLQDDIKSNINIKAYFMCERNADCEYVIYSLIKPVMNKYQVEKLINVTFVDMDDVSRQVSAPRLKELYQIQSVPAFVLVDTASMNILGTLEYSKSNPLTQDLVEEWLLTYGLLR